MNVHKSTHTTSISKKNAIKMYKLINPLIQFQSSLMAFAIGMPLLAREAAF
jgi:hypothetical protein